MGAYLTGIWKKREPPKTPIKGVFPRIKNILKNNFRGIVGVLVPLLLLSWQVEKDDNSKKVHLMWMWMFWFFLLQPVHIPVTGLIPVFVLPMTGVMSSISTCECYMNENIILYFLTSMLILLLNNSGVDKRIALWFLCSGDSCQFAAKRMIFKCSTAAFFLSMFSNRLIVTSVLTQYMTPALMSLKASSAKGSQPDFDEMRYIINNAIQTASGIGSIAILHSSYTAQLFRSIWCEFPPKGKEYPDIFNYLSYSAFAFPLAFIMFICNFCYHMLLCNWFLGKSMSAAQMAELKNSLLKYKSDIPRRTSLHERLSVLFVLVYLLVFFFRWNKWIEGWAEFRMDENHPLIPKVKDATVAAIFVILLHVLPKGYGFTKFFDAEKKSELPPLKAESAILWWRFVDKNTNYGYFFLFGAGIAILTATQRTGLGTIITENFGKELTGHPWNSSIFLVVFLSALLCNIMPSVPACTIFLPLVLAMSQDADLPWPTKSYIGALAVGIATSFGFCVPFMYSPAYFCHHIGKVPVKKMIKYSFLSVWICLILLWAALTLWAPYLFDPNDEGVLALDAPVDGVPVTTGTDIAGT